MQKLGFNYPETKKEKVIDSYFGCDVEDPYRWLEDQNSVETKNWVKKQNMFSRNLLDRLPNRASIGERLNELWYYPKSGVPVFKGGQWFVFKNNGRQNQDVLYSCTKPDGECFEVLNPNEMDSEGIVSISGFDVSSCGQFLVYMLADSGSDWNKIYIKDLENESLLGEIIHGVKFSGLACTDTGFYYSAYPVNDNNLTNKNKGQKVYFHKFGDAQINDEVVYYNSSNENCLYTAELDSSKRYLFILESISTSGNRLLMRDTKNSNSGFVEINQGYEHDFIAIDIVENKLLVRTNFEASNYCLIEISIHQHEQTSWNRIIYSETELLEDVLVCKNNLIVHSLKNAVSCLKRFSIDGQIIENIEIPPYCSVLNVYAQVASSIVYFSYSSFFQPETVVEYSLENETINVIFKPSIKFNTSDFSTKQVWYTSTDGEKIPMFIVGKSHVLDKKNNATILYGYGGFNISLTPSFSPAMLYFMEQGGVFAVANIRGGGEFGEAWHQAGTKTNKQQVFDDYVEAAKFLIKSEITSSAKLVARGGSNGGLLVAAVTNQHPELFRVVLPAVGVLDMLRYQLFTIGYAWATDYGRSDESPEMFDYLLSYSPIHNVKANCYPAIMVSTADHDDRVVPAHSFKYISSLQELGAGNLPTIIRIDEKAGHGSGKPVQKLIEEYIDIFAFIFHYTSE